MKILAYGGRDALCEWYRGATKYTPEEYLEARLAAARRSIDETMEVPLRGRSAAEGTNGAIRGKYLERVRQRFMNPDAPDLPPVAVA